MATRCFFHAIERLAEQYTAIPQGKTDLVISRFYTTNGKRYRQSTTVYSTASHSWDLNKVIAGFEEMNQRAARERWMGELVENDQTPY